MLPTFTDRGAFHRLHGFCRSMFQRAPPWTARTSRGPAHREKGSVPERLPRSDRSLPLDRDSRRRYAGSGAEGHRTLGALSRDRSRERLRPDPDRFRLLVSRALGVTLPGGAGVTGKPPDVAHASKARATAGPRGACPPRRGPTRKCPRSLPSQGRPEDGEIARAAGAGSFNHPAPFSPPGTRARDTRTGPGSSASR